MATLFKPDDAFPYAKFYVKSAPLDNVKAPILQDASSRLWMAGPWRWTLGAITQVALSATQEFTFTKPADFLHFLRLWIVTPSTSQDLQIVATIPAETQVGSPKFAAYVSNSGDKIRLDQVYTGGASHFIRGLYKKNAPDITTTFSDAGALVMDDDWFYVYREFVLYYAYKYADDPRAGGVTVAMTPNGTQRSFTGQLAVCQSLIEDLRALEPVMWNLPQAPYQKVAS